MIKEKFEAIKTKIVQFFSKEEAKVKEEIVTVEDWLTSKEESMKEHAMKVENEVRLFEHKEQMRWMSLLHNWVLLVFIFLTVLFFSKWFVFALILWDFPSYHNKSNK